MIRDKDHVYGEMNDPNTVLAGGTLAANKLIIGTGNKGIRSFSSDKNTLIYIDSGGVNSFSFTPNKLIGTDSAGNLALRPLIEEKHFFQFGGSANPITNVSRSYVDSNLTIGSINNLDAGATQVVWTNSTDIFRPTTFEFEFENSLILSTAKTCRVCAQVMNSGPDFGHLYLKTTSGTEIELGSGLSRAGIGFNADIQLPAGTYKTLIANQFGGAADTNGSILITCLIVY